MAKEKILFVIQRYGEKAAGGAEWHCRQIAERMVDYYDVEVATTMALDYTNWRNERLPETEDLNGVLIRRFKNDVERARDHAHTEAILRTEVDSVPMNVKWIRDQGPLSSKLNDFVKNNHQNYKKVVIFQYLYTVSYYAARNVPAEKLVFVPLAHDEPQVRYPVFRELFRKPKTIVFNAEIEKELAKQTHFVHEKNFVIAGVGIDAPEPEDVDPEPFKKKFDIENYVMFMGRIGPAKRVDVLVNDFILHKKNYPSDLKLVLVGKVIKEMPKHPDIVVTGFVTEEEKYQALKGALALVNPSPYESLSLIVLESFLMKRPIIVNAYCDVLKYHCLKANGGLWYETHLEFDEVLNYMMRHKDDADVMGANGYIYAKEKYGWPVVMEKWLKVLVD